MLKASFFNSLRSAALRGALVAAAAAQLLFFIAAPLSANAAETGRYFAATGYSVPQVFLQYWQTHGGLEIFGYPVTGAHYEQDPISGKVYLTQWFERNRFELHPENVGTPYEVLLGLLGVQISGGRRSESPFQPATSFNNSRDRRYFSETSHSLSFGFKAYWEAHGGLEVFGYPISEEFQESTPQGSFTVQYFERNRFEYHPELRPPYQVELGLLGDELKHPVISEQQQDRSTPEALIDSYYNAVNRHEYQRAYSYWETPGDSHTSVPPDFNTFINGYAQTAAVVVVTGKVTENGAAGSAYNSVAVVLEAYLNNGQTQRFYGCYVTRQVKVPVGNTVPPYPLSLYKAKIFTADGNASLTALLDLSNELVFNQNCV